SFPRPTMACNLLSPPSDEPNWDVPNEASPTLESRMLKRLRSRQKGFTLIELLIVVAIIGIIAALLIPNFLDALQKDKQKRTVTDMRNIGTRSEERRVEKECSSPVGATENMTKYGTVIHVAHLGRALHSQFLS